MIGQDAFMDDERRGKAPREASGIRRMSRREMLRTVGTLASALSFVPALRALDAASEMLSSSSTSKPLAIPKRPLGRTGVEVSILALGGSHVGRLPNERDAARLVHEAIDAGLNFMDNAWEYHDGRSEEWMGRALEGRRHAAFLMTKVCSHGRDKRVAMQQLEESLRRLRTDYLDLWQIHEVIYEDDPDRHFAPDGAVEALLEAKQQGKVRFIGFTGHKDPAIHLKMLRHDVPFDTCQLPLNCFDGTFRSFEHQVLPELERRGIAPLAMKTLNGNGDAVRQGLVSVEEALRYALSLPVASVVSGIDSMEVLRQNLDIARRFTPMTVGEMTALRSRVAQYARDGRYEPYKTSRRYDGPIGRGQHGLASATVLG
jgi:aryl-alcohol dehydrogenase-like predicted oxidoreductase